MPYPYYLDQPQLEYTGSCSGNKRLLCIHIQKLLVSVRAWRRDCRVFISHLDLMDSHTQSLCFDIDHHMTIISSPTQRTLRAYEPALCGQDNDLETSVSSVWSFRANPSSQWSFSLFVFTLSWPFWQTLDSTTWRTRFIFNRTTSKTVFNYLWRSITHSCSSGDVKCIWLKVCWSYALSHFSNAISKPY